MWRLFVAVDIVGIVTTRVVWVAPIVFGVGVGGGVTVVVVGGSGGNDWNCGREKSAAAISD